MANPIEVQRTMSDFHITFISQEKLGVLFQKIQIWETTKKARAAQIRWLEDTLQRLGLIPHSSRLALYAIAIGSDGSGNYGVFVLQEPVIIVGELPDGNKE